MWGKKFGRRQIKGHIHLLAFSISNLLLLRQGLLLSVHVLNQWALSPVQFGERSTEVSLDLEYPWTPGSEIISDFAWWSDSHETSTTIPWWTINPWERKKSLNSDKWPYLFKWNDSGGEEMVVRIRIAKKRKNLPLWVHIHVWIIAATWPTLYNYGLQIRNSQTYFMFSLFRRGKILNFRMLSSKKM